MNDTSICIYITMCAYINNLHIEKYRIKSLWLKESHINQLHQTLQFKVLCLTMTQTTDNYFLGL